MNIAKIITVCLVGIAMRAFALDNVEPRITVTAQQRYPWNGKFDISYTASDVHAACQSQSKTASLKVFAVERTSHVTNAAETTYHSGDLAVSDGTHKFVWDMDAQGAFKGLVSTNFEVFVSVEMSQGVQLWKDGPYWAECNIGATKPEEHGYYFWWGDTVGYKRNENNDGWISVADGTSFEFSDGNCQTYGKDDSALRALGYIDSTGNLASAHDAATAHLGAPWRMPTYAEMGKLISNCDTTWTNRNGVAGRLVSGRGAFASKSIFLPAAGTGFWSYLYGTASWGTYWSSTPRTDNSDVAWFLYFSSGNFFCDSYPRCYGYSVRPLREFSK